MTTNHQKSPQILRIRQLRMSDLTVMQWVSHHHCQNHNHYEIYCTYSYNLCTLLTRKFVSKNGGAQNMLTPLFQMQFYVILRVTLRL